MATTTTFQIGSYNGLTDAFTLVLDLNDRATYYLQSYDLGIPARADVRAFNIRTPGEVVERFQYKNATTTATVMVRAATTTALLAAVRSLVAAIEVPPYVLKVQLPGGTQVSYGDVVGVTYSIPSRPKEILAGALNKVTIHFERKPFWRGARQWLANAVTNPGFEAPSGPGVPVFSDTLANFNAYTLAQNAYRNEVMADGPLRYYRLGESSGTVAQDATNSGNNGTYVASPTLGVAGAAGMGGDTAVTLNGTTQYVSAATTSLPTAAAAWTIAVWCYITGNPAGTVTLTTYGLQSTAHGAPQIEMNNLGQILVGDATSFTAASAALSLNTWHFVAATYDGVTIRAYVDGAAGNTVAATVATPASGTFATLGATAAASPGQFFPGRLDEAAFYSTTLSAARITTLYQIGLNTFALGSLAQDVSTFADLMDAEGALRYYRHDEQSGTTLVDAGSTLQNGTLAGGFTLNQTSLLTGDTDPAITFNGTTGKATGNITGLPTGNSPWAIHAVFKVAAYPATTTPICGFGTWATAKSAPHIGINTTGGVFAGTYSGDTAASAAIGLNTVVRVMATYDGTTLRCYLNGTLSASATPGPLTVSGSGSPLYFEMVNGQTNNQFINGTLDEVAIFGADKSARAAAFNTAATTTPTATANTMTIPAEGRVQFGSPNWGAINTWQTRFRYVSGLTAATWYLHYTDANNYLAAQVTGTAVTLAQAVGGVNHTLATSSAINLVNGVQYWLQVTQFPTIPNNSAYVQATLFGDANGAIGTQVVQATGLTFDAVTALSGKPQLAVTGGALAIGGNFASIHSVSLFGPGGWTFSTAGTFPAWGAWDGTVVGIPAATNANTYPNGITTSYGAARIDGPTAGTLDVKWRLYTGGAPAGTQAIPVQTAGNVIQANAWVRSSSLGVAATIKLEITEFNSSGGSLGTTVLQTLTGNQAAWVQVSGTRTTQAGTAYVDIAIHAADTNAGASANCIVWIDNVQAWDQTRTGATTMPYCELRSPMAAAQLTVSGLVGDVPTPAFLMAGVYMTAWNTGQSATLYLGRRAMASADMQLLGAPNTLGSTPFLDSADPFGWQTRLLTGQVLQPIPFSATIKSALGTYHLLARGYTANAVPSGVAIQTQLVVGTAAWYLPGTFPVATLGTAVYPFKTQNAWAIVDVGQVTIPPAPLGATVDLTQQYVTPGASSLDISAAQQRQGVNVLMPVDAELAVLHLNNPLLSAYYANYNTNVVNQWFMSYLDGMALSANYSLEAGPLSGAAHAGGVPGTNTSVNYNINSVADSRLQVDPTRILPTSNGQGVNQWAAFAYDSNNLVFTGLIMEVQYSPLFTYPQ